MPFLMLMIEGMILFLLMHQMIVLDAAGEHAPDDDWKDRHAHQPGPNPSDSITIMAQITDLHLNEESRCALDAFRVFLIGVVPMIRPAAVMVTGDITDSKKRRGRGSYSRASISEWEQYRSALDEARNVGALRKETLWVDVAGNHDRFGVRGLEDRTNHLYATYGESSPPQGPGSDEAFHDVNVYDLKAPAGAIGSAGHRYRLVRVDTALRRGPHRPLNFFGNWRP